MSGIGKKQSTVAVLLLNKSLFTIPITTKTRFGDILINIRKRLKLSSSNLFGLAYKTDHGDFRFLDPLCKVWKKDKLVNQGADSSEGITHIYLRVQYYVEPGHHFRSVSDRKYYFLQLKENFLRYGFNYPDDRCFLLASYALHSDEVLGRDFDPREYFPTWILKSYGTQFVRKHMPTIKPVQMTPSQAMTMYINELSSPSPYIYNMRLYKAQSTKSRNTNNVRIGISQEGVEVYEVDCRGYLNFLNSCNWTQITAIHSLKRKIVISVNLKNFEFYTSSEEWCKELCSMIKSDQRVYLGLDQGGTFQPDHFFPQDGTCFRESYIYSGENNLEWDYENSSDTLTSLKPTLGTPVSTSSVIHSPTTHNELTAPDQSRFSIISTTSSTTTSGIVSDRTCLSTEVSQEDLISSPTRPSSFDSLLDSETEYVSPSSANFSATVQRAISEPSKKFQNLRYKVQECQNNLPRRALSDKTIDEPDYENIAIIRKTLGITHTSPPKVTQKLSMSKSADQLSLNRLVIQSPRSSNGSYGLKMTYHCPSTSSPTQSHHKYNLISNSPSMEKLLLDYIPPPSYSEAHARQRQLMLSSSTQASDDSTNSSFSSSLTPYTPFQPSTPVAVRPFHKPSYSKQISEHADKRSSPVGKKLRKQAATTSGQCSCLKLSNPEIDRLREEVKNAMVSLPMLSALCNDKQLLETTNQCTCNTPTKSPRPISWHCESEPAFTFPVANAVNGQPVAHIR